MERTFAGDREQDNAARSSYVRHSQVPYEIYLSILAADKETYSEY
jgi:hypothetical protein